MKKENTTYRGLEIVLESALDKVIEKDDRELKRQRAKKDITPVKKN